MASLPESDVYLLVRTYFGDDGSWDALRREIEQGTDEGFQANVEFVDDRQFEALSLEDLEVLHPHRADERDVLYVADQRAVSDSSHPLLVVRVGNGPDLPFRCRADVLYEVDANLSLANLDWDDLRDQIDESGVYGGRAVAEPDPKSRVKPAVAAYQAGSKNSIEIPLPAGMWFLIYNDLWDAGLQVGVIGYKQHVAIAERIVQRDQGVKQRMDDPDIIKLPANEWAFIHARAEQLQTEHDPDHDDGRPHGDVASEIAQVVSRYLP